MIIWVLSMIILSELLFFTVYQPFLGYLIPKYTSYCRWLLTVPRLNNHCFHLSTDLFNTTPSHLSTDLFRHCLTSEIEREPVLLARCDRKRLLFFVPRPFGTWAIVCYLQILISCGSEHFTPFAKDPATRSVIHSYKHVK